MLYAHKQNNFNVYESPGKLYLHLKQNIMSHIFWKREIGFILPKTSEEFQKAQ